MKTLTAISLFIFWSIVTAILAAGLVFYQDRPGTVTSTSNKSDGTSGMTAKAPITTTELVKHTAASDCWLLIAGKVYDVSLYVYQHPGNADTIIPNCGKDATSAYATKGNAKDPRPHSAEATALLAKFYIGDIEQVAQTMPTSGNTTISDGMPPTGKTGSASLKQGASVTLSSQEIAKHARQSDCWLVIDDNVYNVTSYLGSHSGGISIIVPYCGKDASTAFAGDPHAHSQSAYAMLKAYLLGPLGKTTSTSTIRKAQIAPAPSQGTAGELGNE